ncbi:MAG: restriction endonuclease subunit S [Saprospiraceae bacterium]|nr:restriction endonuclease subunit S [Candidatus Vicinibacter proximus]
MIETALENTKTAWLGEFPAHWEVLRIKNLFQEMDSRSETGSEELLSVSHYTGVTLKRESLENEDDHLTNAESLVGYKLVHQGDLVINIMLAWNGSLGISPYNGITSPAYCVYRIKGDNNPEYFGYLFTTNLFKAEFRRHSTGIIDSRLRLYTDKFFSIFTVLPPKNEQDEIVQYIKAQEEKINLFIQKKQKFIELLKEQRQCVVDNSITKNIAACKDIRLKYISSRIGDGLHGTPQYVDYSEFKFINGNNLINGTIVTNDETNCVTEEEFNNYDLKLKKGTILYSINGTIGNMAFYDGEPVVLGKSAAYIEPDEISKSVVDYDYLFQYLQTNRVMKYFLNATASTTIKNLSLFTLRNTPVLVPHTLEQQKQIVSHIKTETATIDTAIAKAEREIELIREYKEAMIAEAVMGKRRINNY